MALLGRVWNIVTRAVDGLKTLGIAAIFFLLGLADYFDIVNIKPVLDLVLGEDRSAKIMVVLPIVFATLRFVSTGAPRWTKQWREQKVEEAMVPPSTPEEESNHQGEPF